MGMISTEDTGSFQVGQLVAQALCPALCLVGGVGHVYLGWRCRSPFRLHDQDELRRQDDVIDVRGVVLPAGDHLVDVGEEGSAVQSSARAPWMRKASPLDTHPSQAKAQMMPARMVAVRNPDSQGLYSQ